MIVILSLGGLELLCITVSVFRIVVVYYLHLRSFSNLTSYRDFKAKGDFPTIFIIYFSVILTSNKTLNLRSGDPGVGFEDNESPGSLAHSWVRHAHHRRVSHSLVLLHCLLQLRRRHLTQHGGHRIRSAVAGKRNISNMMRGVLLVTLLIGGPRLG